jgi:hypothetical protein
MLPKRAEFFDLLAAHSERVLSGASAMLRLISSLGISKQDVAALVEEINMNETSADQIKADLLTMLHKSFVTPLNRDQVYKLTLDIDSVMNAVQDVAQAASIYNITEANSRVARAGGDDGRRLHAPDARIAVAEKRTVARRRSICASKSSASKRNRSRSCTRPSRALFETEGDEVAALRACACDSSTHCRKKFCGRARNRPRRSKRFCSRMPEIARVRFAPLHAPATGRFLLLNFWHTMRPGVESL